MSQPSSYEVSAYNVCRTVENVKYSRASGMATARVATTILRFLHVFEYSSGAAYSSETLAVAMFSIELA